MPAMDPSDPGSPFEIADFAQDIVELMDHLGLTKVHLIGHSMGSMIAQEIALHHPQRLVSLSLLGTTADPMHNGSITGFLERDLLFGTWKRHLENSFGKDWRKKSYWMPAGAMGPEHRAFLREHWVTEDLAPTPLLEAIHEETLRVPLGTWFGALEAMLEVDNSRGLENLGTRTLVLWASADGLFPGNPDQRGVKTALKRAFQRHGTVSLYRTYAHKGAAPGGIGHNFHWAIPQLVAHDLYQFTVHGRLGKDSGQRPLPQIDAGLEVLGR